MKSVTDKFVFGDRPIPLWRPLPPSHWTLKVEMLEHPPLY